MFPKSHFTANGKYPELGGGYDRKRGHYIDPFWQKQADRWLPKIDGPENLREQIIEMNVCANQCRNFRHFELPRMGIIDVFGDGMFSTQHLGELREAVATAFQQITVSDMYPAGQGMYGFTIHMVNIPVGTEKQTMQSLSIVINTVQEKQV